MRKVELEHCPIGGFHCQKHLDKINELLNDAQEAIDGKDYLIALDAKLEAFDETLKITNPKCFNCTNLFRSVIMDSVDKQKKYSSEMSSGLFKTKRYKSLKQKSVSLLKKMEMKNKELKSQNEKEKNS